MKSNVKVVLIIVGIVIALALVFLFWGIGVNNSVVKAEEQIAESKSSIDIVIKKRNDSISQLVQVVEKYSEHETSIIQSVTEARSKLNSGDVSGATTILNAIFENYPTLTATETYKTLMNEISINENSIARHRDNFNQQVKAYKKSIRIFPNTLFLSISGYEPVEVDYIEFSDNQLDFDIDNIFGE